MEHEELIVLKFQTTEQYRDSDLTLHHSSSVGNPFFSMIDVYVAALALLWSSQLSLRSFLTTFVLCELRNESIILLALILPFFEQHRHFPLPPTRTTLPPAVFLSVTCSRIE